MSLASDPGMRRFLLKVVGGGAVAICLLVAFWVWLRHEVDEREAERRAADTPQTYVEPLRPEDVPWRVMTWEEARDVGRRLGGPADANIAGWRKLELTVKPAWERKNRYPGTTDLGDVARALYGRAIRGDIEAQADLALMHGKALPGVSYPDSYGATRCWIQVAATRGDPAAQYLYADSFYERAFPEVTAGWIKRAARQGLPAAVFAYASGWRYEESARNVDADLLAYYYLAYAYDKGVPYLLQAIAADAGDEKQRYRLNMIEAALPFARQWVPEPEDVQPPPKRYPQDCMFAFIRSD